MRRQLSLRSRLLLAAGTIALLALLVADVVVYASLRSYLYGQVDTTLAESQIAVLQAIGNQGAHQGQPAQGGPDGGGPGPTPASRFCGVGRESAPGMFIEVRGRGGAVDQGEECPAFVPGSSSYTPALPTTITGYADNAAAGGAPTTYFTVSSTVTGGPSFRVLASVLADGGVLVLAEPIGSLASTLEQLLVLELSVTGVALVGSLLLGLLLVRIGLKPLSDVVRTAEAITAGDLMHRVPGASERTEVGRVGAALNVMLERIQAAFRELQLSEGRLRRFVSDASHELRTPVAAVSAYAQLFRSGAAAKPEDLERVMTGIERESGRMARLVDDLLLLARLDEHALPDLAPVELVGLAAEAIETSRTVDPSHPLTLVAGDPVEVLGDHGTLRQVVDNLLGNVRSHTPAGTVTVVTVGTSGAEALLEVADNGPGIGEDEATMLFERFFRSDPSRSRESGGAGLGLAIVAAIVNRHGGRVDAAPATGGGAVFTVSLPLLETARRAEEPA